jgi:hypothetical protein
VNVGLKSYSHFYVGSVSNSDWFVYIRDVTLFTAVFKPEVILAAVTVELDYIVNIAS